MRAIRFKVLQEDIDNASHGTTNCPLANCIKRVLGTPRVRVNYDGIDIDYKFYNHCTSSKRLLNVFDGYILGAKCKPCVVYIKPTV